MGLLASCVGTSATGAWTVNVANLGANPAAVVGGVILELT